MSTTFTTLSTDEIDAHRQRLGDMVGVANHLKIRQIYLEMTSIGLRS